MSNDNLEQIPEFEVDPTPLPWLGCFQWVGLPALGALVSIPVGYLRAFSRVSEVIPGISFQNYNLLQISCNAGVATELNRAACEAGYINYLGNGAIGIVGGLAASIVISVLARRRSGN